MADRFTWALGPFRSTHVLIHENEAKQQKPLVVGLVDGSDQDRWWWRVLGPDGEQGRDPAVSYPAAGKDEHQSMALRRYEAVAATMIETFGRPSVGPNGRGPTEDEPG